MEDGGAARARALLEFDLYLAGSFDRPPMELVLAELSESGSINADVRGPMRSLGRTELELLVRLANAEDREGGDLEKLEVGFGKYNDARSVQNAAWFVSRVAGLRDLSLRHGGEEGEVDDFLEAVASGPAPAPRLRRLALDYVGGRPGAWRRFADRFEAGIESLALNLGYITDAMAAEVTSSLRSGFRSLDAFELRWSSTTEQGGRSTALALLGALPDGRAIKTLAVDISDEIAEEPSHVEPLMEEQNCVGDLALRCSSLNALRFSVTWFSAAYGAELESWGYNGALLLERLLGSKSLEDIDVQLKFAGVESFPEDEEDESGANTIRYGLTNNQFRVTNHNVKTIRLRNYRIGEESSILACYKGLKSIEFKNIWFIHDSAARTATSALASLDQLESFSFSNTGFYWEKREVPNEHIMWIASTIQEASSLRSVKLHLKYGNHGNLSALHNVLVNCSADLSLKLRLEEEASFLVSGIQAAQALPSFELSLKDMPAHKSSFESILDAVQSSRGLRRFVFTVNGSDDSWPYLDPFLSGNTNLDFFGLGIEFPVLSDSVVSFADDQAVVSFAVRGLRHNRRLQTINFCIRQFHPGREKRRSVKYLGPIRVTVATSEQIVAMLQQFNTTLQQIEGLEYESREHEERINCLLELNRHGKDFAENGDRVPIGLWGDVLSRISNTECNSFVTEKVQQACGSYESPSSGLHDPGMKSLRDELARTKDRLAEAEDESALLRSENASLREQLESLREMSARHGRELEQALGASRGKRRR